MKIVNISIGNDRVQIIIIAFFFILAAALIYANQIHVYSDISYTVGDWLINYEGGPVRRGLIGQALLILSSLRINLIWASYILQIAITFLIVYLTLRLYLFVERDISWLMVLFSPAFVI